LFWWYKQICRFPLLSHFKDHPKCTSIPTSCLNPCKKEEASVSFPSEPTFSSSW
jgi:hypothetical protein